MNDIKTEVESGLTTEEALKKLYQQIDQQLAESRRKLFGYRSFRYLIIESFRHSSVRSTFRWTSIFLLGYSTIVYYIAYTYGHFNASFPLLIEATILLLLLIFNMCLIFWDTKSRHIEIHRKARQLSEQIKSCFNNKQLIESWKTLRYYPHLNTPQSPCISLQWTFRDNKRINLPVPLLVAGDVILMSPGRAAPAKCRSIEPVIPSQTTLNNTSNPEYCLNAGELFVPIIDCASESFTTPRLRRAARPVKFVVLETPFIEDLKKVISVHSTRNHATAFEKELNLIFVRYVERIIVPIIWAVVMVVSAIHYGYLETFADERVTSWPASLTLLLLRPVMAILPLLPLTLPFCWLMLNVFGLSRLFHICVANYDKQDITNIQGSPGSILTGSNIGRAKEEYLKSSSKDFYMEELDSERSNVPLINTKLSCLDMIVKMRELLSNRDTNLWRTTNLLHVLGSITAFCCVDKKGILSWPNPTVDKVFFLTSNQSNNKLNKNNDESDSNSEDSDFERNSIHKKDKPIHKSSLYSNSKAECIQLDITHDQHNAYGLQFDDTEWQKYLSNLKPLGLAILLNTCNQEAQEEFIQFCDHVACESLHNEAAVPVVNKRCLCELARQIGFTENAIKGYEYQSQIAMFRHIRPEVIQKGKLAKSLNFPRLKMPFPNMTSSVIKDIYTNTFQIFSQGTGDLVLDACTEYWDGHDLCVLTDSDRKKILDFYHRSSLTSYCSAFAYVPLNSLHETVTLHDCYIELTPDSSHLFPSQKSLDSSLRSSEHHNLQVITDKFLSAKIAIQSHHLSSDSLAKVEENRCHRPKSSDSTSSADNYNLENLMHQISNQVFIGMTTMQYQACSDFVRLVEQLETACIRFVHFSKENELRSRVFSEKMGLESGWNCHISLLNDDIHCDYGPNAYHFPNNMKGSKSSIINESQTITVCRTQSAPGSVNLEISTVKFANDCDVESIDDKISYSDSGSHNEEDTGALIQTERAPSSESRRMSKATSNLSPSPSRMTTSTGTDNSAPIAFDMSNRAKLPKGIENIRPHLENVDNVPLLVSLFTDCVPEATKEMIQIMQEYGEVVCVVGSSANNLNVAIFLQADASIGVEPMYPQVCITEPIREADGFIESLPDNFIGPTDLARQLITLPCSLSLYRQNSMIFYQLILESRHYMLKMRNCFQFFLSSCLSLSLAQLLTSLLFLPPLLSPGVVLWLACIVLPILSCSLLGSDVDDQVMSIATGKKLHLNKESIVYFFMCYLIKFAPSVFVSVLCFGLMISNSCHAVNIGQLTAGPCWMFSDVKSNYDIKTDYIWSSQLLMAQTIASLFLVLYIVIISIGFVHRNHLIWQRSPLINKWWIVISISLLISHALLCLIEISLYVKSFEITINFIQSIPTYVWCLGFLWPFLLISINTMTKRHEIKVSSRQQRRARLEFGTKLGMNSPF